MPETVLRQVAHDMLDWRGSGMSVMEMSHRGSHFGEIHTQALADFRELMAVPPEFKILFMQGGGLAENAIVPLNLSRGGLIDVVHTGEWSKKSSREAARYAQVNVAAVCDTVISEPTDWRLSAGASYVHLCTNETINGLEFVELPDLKALGCDSPLVIDFSSHVLSRTIEWSRVGLAFGGAQKNVGPAGLTVVVVREDLLDRALPSCPSAFHYATVAANNSMYNTPPTFAIYVAGLVFAWVKAQGGVAQMSANAQARSDALYAAIDRSALYSNGVHPSCRSRMNIPFSLNRAGLDAAFLDQAQARGLLQLKGHKSVGGMRASLYNAMPQAGVQALTDFLADFAANHP